MKQKISYSSVISGITVAIFVIYVAIFVLFWVFINKPFDNVFFWILIGLFCLCFLWIFGTMPSSVYADDDYVGINEPLRNKRIPLSDIKSVEVTDRQRSGFHGKYKYPILITFKDGSTYIIGSEEPDKFVEYVNSRLS